jgi:hypothetical protein
MHAILGVILPSSYWNLLKVDIIVIIIYFDVYSAEFHP